MTTTKKPPARLTPGPARLLDMGQAAEELGLTGRDRRRSVLNLLRKKEKALKRKLVFSMGGEGRGARYFVARSVLLEICPARSKSEDMAEAITEVMAELRAENAELREQMAELRESQEASDKYLRIALGALRKAGLLEPVVAIAGRAAA